MANFAVAATPETIERANKVMEMYAQDGDKKEDTLRRILDLAESERVRGTHPELESSLKAVDVTIGTLIKQINGIVSGQDAQIADLKERINIAIEERQIALDQAKKQVEEAQNKVDVAEKAIRDAAEKSSSAIEDAIQKRDQAYQERDDARTIAAEKASTNDLLMRQLTSLEKEASAYKELQEQYKSLQTSYISLQAELETLKQKTETARVQAELERERAVMEKEREFQERLRQADIENAKLLAKIEALQNPKGN